MNKLFQNLENIPRFGWITWILTLIVVFSIQLITLDDLLHIYKDQVQITDYGRLTLNPRSDWSLTWRLAEEKPILLWSYLGPLIAEVSYHLSGASGIGSRIAALTGGLLAATMIFGWLRSIKVATYAAFGLSLAFLLDPLFVLSQRLGRMDSWVFALCLAACWILRKSAKNKSKYIRKTMLAGSLAVVAGMTWPSAVFLYPLIILELIRSEQGERTFGEKWKEVVGKLGYFCLGGIITGLILLIPIWENLMIIFGDMSTMVARNVDSSNNIFEKFLSFFDYQVWFKLVKIHIKTLSFFLPVLALAAVIFRRNKSLIIVTILTIALIFSSLVYEFRALYLLPYYVALSGTIFLKNKREAFRFRFVKLRNIGLSVLILWAIGVSIFLRTAMAMENRPERFLNEIYETANSEIGEGPFKVFLGFNYEFYFAGRSLNWQLYNPYVKYEFDENGNWISDNKYEPTAQFENLLSKMDYAIFKESEVSNDLEKQIQNSGLNQRRVLNTEDKVTPDKKTSTNSTKEKILWYLNGGDTKVSYILYSRLRPEENKKRQELIHKLNLAQSADPIK